MRILTPALLGVLLIFLHLIDQVIVATDSEEVLQVVRRWGGEARMTSSECQSGSERVASLIKEFESE